MHRSTKCTTLWKESTLRLKKKITVVAASVAAALAIGTGAWAYITATGSGTGTANASATAATLTFDVSATIEDLDDPAAITVKATSNKANRRINTLAITVSAAPVGCNVAWFSVTGGNGATENTSNTGWTLTTANVQQTLDTGLQVTLNNADAAQDACLTGPITLAISAA